MYESLYDYIRSAKYASVFALTALFPTETVMPLVGFAAANGHVSFPLAVLAGAAGATLGSVVVYGIARLISAESLHAFITKYGKWLGITNRRVEKAGRWFDRHAQLTVFLGRFVPGIRTAVCVPAGIRRMPFGQYVTFTLLGSAACSTILAYLGFIARDRIAQIQALITGISSFIYLFLLTLLAGYVFWRLNNKK